MVDDSLLRAIAALRDSFGRFRAAFRHRERAQTDFVVVFLRERGSSLVPVGALVDEIKEDVILGRELENQLAPRPRGRIACNVSELVDWRYTDTFELVGGALYRELFQQQHHIVQTKIRDVVPFLIYRGPGEYIDERSLGAFRDVANGRLDRIKKLPVSDLGYSGLSGMMPTLTFDIGRRVEVYLRTLARYAASYGTSSIIDYLIEQGGMNKGMKLDTPPLIDSCYAGNYDTTKRLLEHGFDPNCKDDLECGPLHMAARCDHRHIVQLLLEPIR